MEGLEARTEFVRRAIEGRRIQPDESYAKDLVQLERLAASRPLGLASSLAFSNLVSRYPREADGITRELGIHPFEPIEDERMRSLMAERLRLAELRHPLGRRTPTGDLGLFEF